jgi:hypothetical protein
MLACSERFGDGGLPSRMPCRSVSKNPAENLLYLFLIRNIRVKWVAEKQNIFQRPLAHVLKPILSS